MHISVLIPEPKNEQDFEELCGHVFGVAFKDQLPKNNGRRGQKQYGVDLFIQREFIQDKSSRVGIQCKAVKKLSLNDKTGDSVYAEVAKADSGNAQISHLIIATTLPNDAKLTHEVQLYSDSRAKSGLFTVAIDFWEDISQRIRFEETLLNKYTSTSDASNLLLEQSTEYYRDNRYRLVIQNLETPKISLDSFSPKQKATRVRLLALSYGYLNELKKSESLIEEVMHLDSYSIETYCARILIAMLKYDSATVGQIINEAKIDYPTEKSIIVFELLHNSDSNQSLPEFEDLEIDLRCEDNIVRLYLRSYLKDKKFEKFHALYAIQNIAIRENPVYSWLYLDALYNQTTLDNNYSDENKEKVRGAIQAFTPRHTKLWSIENIQLLSSVVTLLACSYLMLNEVDEAYQTFKDFKEIGHTLEERQLAMYIEVSAQVKPESLQNIIIENSDNINGALLFHIYQIALAKNITSALEKLDEIAQLITDQTYIDAINALKWETDFSSDPSKTIFLIEHSKILDSISVAALCITGDIIYKFNKSHQMLNEITVKLKHLFELQSNSMNRQNITAYYLNIRLFEEAIPLLRQSIKIDSEALYPKIKLIECFVETNRLREAKDLLSSFSKFQLDNDELRFQALRLAQKTYDWDYLTKLLVYEETQFKNHARTWLLKFDISLRKSSTSEIRKLAKDLPLNLIGHPSDIGRLARLEMQYGKQDKALKRVYTLARRDFRNPKARIEFINLILGQALNYYEISILNQQPHIIQAGTTIQFKDDFGHSSSVSIDIDCDLPELESFISPKSELALKLCGKSIGDTFTQTQLGLTRTYSITQIDSIYLRFHHLLLEKSYDVSLDASNFICFKLDVEKDGIDGFLKIMSDDLEKRASQVDNIFSQYKEHPFTIGMIAKMLGKETYELLHNWPKSIAQRLIVSDGSQNDIDSSRNFIVQGDFSNVVVDATTLIEIARNQMWEVFHKFQTVYISSTSNEKIIEWLFDQESSLNRQTGTMFFDNGLRMMDIDQNQKQLVCNNLKMVRQFIDTEQCEVLASYGEAEENPNKLRFYDLLSADEFSGLRLAKEKSCALLSFDARLRQFAILDGIKTIQPNLLYQNLYEKSEVSERDYHVAMGIQFISNRWCQYEYLPDVFAWYCAQGEWQAKCTLHKIRNLMSAVDSIEFAIQAVIIKLQESLLRVMEVTIGAYAEVVSYLISGLKENPEYNESIHLPMINQAVASLSSNLSDSYKESYSASLREDNPETGFGRMSITNQIYFYFLDAINRKLIESDNKNTFPNVGVVFANKPELFLSTN